MSLTRESSRDRHTCKQIWWNLRPFNNSSGILFLFAAFFMNCYELHVSHENKNTFFPSALHTQPIYSGDVAKLFWCDGR